MMNLKVLVTGANGQLGQTIRELFSENDDDIEFVFVEKKILDITDGDAVEAFFKDNDFSHCINCAAYTNVEQAEESSGLAFEINAEAAKKLATTCDFNNVILVHISTDYVFDGEAEEPYVETHVTNPLNEYGKSKLLGEHHISQIVQNHFIIRTSWLYSKYGKNFFKTIVAKINENAPLKITTAEVGTPTSCIDLSRFLYSLILSNNDKYGVYHYSNEGKATWYDFATEIATHFKDYDMLNISPVDFFKTKAKRPEYSVLSKSKVKNLFGEAIPNWKNSIEAILKDE